MKVPGPDHPITMAASPQRVRVRLGDRVIADSQSALVLTEADLPPVYYIPRGDADMELLVRSSTVTHCPYKGDANHYSLQVGDRTVPDAAWTYEQPSPHVGSIQNRLAFYTDKVTIDLD